MKKKKSIVFIFVILAVLLAINVIFWHMASKRYISFIPSDVTNVLYSYLDICENNPEDAVVYTHFENETDKQMYIAAAYRIVGYEILGAEKINDNLYAFTLHIERTFNTYPKRYYFIGKFDDSFKIMVNIGNVPEELQEGLDIERYTLTLEELQPVEQS